METAAAGVAVLFVLGFVIIIIGLYCCADLAPRMPRRSRRRVEYDATHADDMYRKLFPALQVKCTDHTTQKDIKADIMRAEKALRFLEIQPDLEAIDLFLCDPAHWQVVEDDGRLALTASVPDEYTGDLVWAIDAGIICKYFRDHRGFAPDYRNGALVFKIYQDALKSLLAQ